MHVIIAIHTPCSILYALYGDLFILSWLFPDVVIRQTVEDCSACLVGADHRVTSVDWLWLRQTAKLHHENICVDLWAILCRVLFSGCYSV